MITQARSTLFPQEPKAAWLRELAGWDWVFAQNSQPYVLVYTPKRQRFHTTMLAAWRAGKHVIIAPHRKAPLLQALRDLDYLDLDNLAEVADIAPDMPPASVNAHALPADAALSLFTSGSHGAPTRVCKPAAVLAAEVTTLAHHFGAAMRNTTLFCSAGHHHIYGLIYSILWPAYAALACAPRIKDAAALHHALIQAQQRRQAPFSFSLCTTPTFLERLQEADFRLPKDCTCRFLMTTGAPLSQALAAYAARHLCPATEVFGSTECGGIAWRCHDRQNPAWQPLQGVRWRIENRCLAVASPHTGHTDFVQTSDGAQPCGNTFILTGRTDRLYKFRERQISLPGLEVVLQALPDVTQARIAVCPRTQNLKVAIVPSETGRRILAKHGVPALLTSLQRALRPHLPTALPLLAQHICLVPTLARHAALKVCDDDVLRLFT